MEQGYQKRLLGSPYKSPIKPVSPMTTPTKENYLDRYMPSRTNAKWKHPSAYQPSRCLFPEALEDETSRPRDSVVSPSAQNTPAPESVLHLPEEADGNGLLSEVLHNELIDAAEGSITGNRADHQDVLAPRENCNIFSFKLRKESPCKLQASTFTLSPVSEKSQRLLLCPQKPSRHIPKMPYKVLDAPELQDDFYLNLVDWSSQNLLAVGLGTCVYLWNAFNSQVIRLCDFSDERDAISSVSWSKKGVQLAVATYRGHVHIWDVVSCKCLRRLEGHLARVGALAWNHDLLASGSRDRQILLRDVRATPTSGGGRTAGLTVGSISPGSGLTPENPFKREAVPLFSAQQMEVEETERQFPASRTPISNTLPSLANQATCESLSMPLFDEQVVRTNYGVSESTAGCVRVLKDHLQEVCGLKWSPDNQYLASGGNDNRLLVWSHHTKSYSSPVLAYEEHVAAVKAIAWSPHQHGLLASGGGTADRHIRFWNTLTGQALRSVETESQVCNLAWSAHNNELVSTHGYTQNQIIVWRYPSLSQLAKLTGHTYRVLYLATSPDGENIVTGAGDETLRFWNVFAKAKPHKPPFSSFNLFGATR